MQKQLSTCMSVPQTEQVHSFLFSYVFLVSMYFCSGSTLHNLGLDPFSTGVSVRRLGRCTRTPFFVSFRFRLLLASFLRGCLVSLLSLGCSPFSLSFSRWCAGACVFRPVICFDLLCLSLCVGCFSVCVPSVFLWCCGFMLAWLRFPLSCPPLGWSGAFPAGLSLQVTQ